VPKSLRDAVDELDESKLAPAMKTALVYLAHAKTLEGRVKVANRGRARLLTFWSNIPTDGDQPLYERLFLTTGAVTPDRAFDDPVGEYLTKGTAVVGDHLTALQGGLNLTAEEVRLILEDAGKDLATTPLSLEIVSLLFRHQVLAQALKLSVRELIVLKQLSGVDPFTPLLDGELAQIGDDHPFLQTLRFVEIAGIVKASGSRSTRSTTCSAIGAMIR